MPSAVEIVNLALARLGQGAPIASLDEESEPAIQANAVLPFCLDEVLRATDWHFATRRVTLALVVGADPTPWDYAYRVPSDCLRVIDLPVITSTEQVPFELAGDDSGELLLTDLNPATLRYITRVDNLALWPSQVAGALAWLLAAELATTLARDNTRADRLTGRYGKALNEAIALAAGEARQRPDADPHFIAART